MRSEPQPWLTADALVFVDDVDVPQLSDPDAHHLARVLRLRPGDEVCVTDGVGRWRLCEFVAPSGIEATDNHGDSPDLGTPLTVGIAIVKGDKPELVVQKLTELGIDRIVFFHARRSVARWREDKLERNLERLNRIALSAACQSRRLTVPTIENSDAKHLVSEGAAVADFGGRELSAGDHVVLIGPEGGWEPGEYGQAPVVDLGPSVLRAETAAIAVAARMCALRTRRFE